MPRSRVVQLFAGACLLSFILCVAPPACATGGSHPRNPAIPALAAGGGVVRHLAGPGGPGSEQGPLGYAEQWLEPLAFPQRGLNAAARDSAFHRLQAFRDSLHLPYLFPGNKVLLNASTVGPACGWLPTGPSNLSGRVTGMACADAKPWRILLSTAGGLWRSETSGRTWECVSQDLPDFPFGCVAINPSDPDEMFAGSGDSDRGRDHTAARAASFGGAGIYRSTHGGRPGSWVNVMPGLSGEIVFRIRVDARNDHDVFAATSAGVYHGHRSGQAMVWDLVGNVVQPCCDLVLDSQTTPPTLFAAAYYPGSRAKAEILKFRSGPGWDPRSTGIPVDSRGRIALAICAASPATLYAKVEKDCATCADSGRLLGIYRTDTSAEPPAGGGDAWKSVEVRGITVSESVFWYNSVIEVDPKHADNVFLGGVHLWHKANVNASADWKALTRSADPAYDPNPFYLAARLHEDVHAILLGPDSKSIYVGTDGGVDHCADITTGAWHWDHISHDLQITEVYSLSSQDSRPSVIAAGAQDNGRMVTLGNRTWYGEHYGDYYVVGMDGVNPCLVYGTQRRARGFLERLRLLVNPIPGTVGYGGELECAGAGPCPTFPVVTDPDVTGSAVAAAIPRAAGTSPELRQGLLKKKNGAPWVTVDGFEELGASQQVWTVAMSYGTAPRHFYAGIRGLGPNAPATAIASIEDGSNPPVSHVVTSGIPANLVPSTIAVDPSNPLRAFVGFGGQRGTEGAISMTTDGGATWLPLSTSGLVNLDDKPVLGIAVNPRDPLQIFAATFLGVFSGTLASTTSADVAWVPFDRGLPNGLRCTALTLSVDAGVLHLGTFGHGTYECRLTDDGACSQPRLVVRDNVYDTGFDPGLADVPDPENPIPVPGDASLYQPNDTDGAQIGWWASPDIRTYVEDPASPQNAVSDADDVEFESCPVVDGRCPAGSMVDADPSCDGSAAVYVQVTNNSLQPLEGVRVLALWIPPSGSLPLLPADFWSQTLPDGSSACGPLGATTPWALIDGYRSIAEVDAGKPAVVKFNWNVPLSAREHSCVLVFADCPGDPVLKTLRASGELNPDVLVPADRHIALRNLHIINCPVDAMAAEAISLYASSPLDTLLDLLLWSGRSKYRRSVGLLLPPKVKSQARDLHPVPIHLGGTAFELAEKYGLDPRVMYVLDREAGSVRGLRVPWNGGTHIALAYGSSPKDSLLEPMRYSIVAKGRRGIVGGSSYLFRGTMEGPAGKRGGVAK